MKSTIIGFLVLGLLVLGSLVQAFAYHGILPERVASHFNAAGEPDGWQSKGEMLLTNIGLVVGIGFVLSPLLYLAIRFAPASMVNMPNKEFWLAEPRQRETRRSLAGYTLWTMNLTLALLAAVMELGYRANLSGNPRLGWIVWGWLGAYGLAMAVLLVALYRKFGKRSMASADGAECPPDVPRRRRS